MNAALFSPRRRRQLSRHLLVWVIAISSAFALLATCFQLYFSFNVDRTAISNSLDLIKNSYVRLVSASSFDLDEKRVRLILQGIQEVQDIALLEVWDGDSKWISIKNADVDIDIRKEYPLEHYDHDGKAYIFGKLVVAASLNRAYQRLWQDAFILFGSNIVKTLLASLFIFILFQRKITRHLTHIASFLQKLDFDNLEDELILDRKTTNPDELSDVIGSINGMRARLIKTTAERKQAEEGLRYLRNYLANIINSMPSVLVGVDINGIITQWNSEAERTTGVTVEAALGQPLAQVFPRLSTETQRIRTAIQTRRKQINPKRVHQQNGETRYEDVTVYPLITNGVEGAVIRVDDVTERVRIEEMVVQSEKMLSVGGLAAGMAHEINNPLAGVMQAADVLIRRLTGDLPANECAAKEAGTTMTTIRTFMEARKIPKMLENIHESGHRAAEIVSNMLNFARKSCKTVSNYNLAELLDRCVDLAGSDYDLKKKYDFRKIKIIREYEENFPLAPCEAGTIQQVMLNVLRNGAEAMQADDGKEPQFTLRIAHEPAAGNIRIEIEDNGPGMKEELCKRIFEPFYTTKPIGVGTGLGLSVSYFIITENHGGEMYVESQLGQGTKFIILLPIENPPKASLPSRQLKSRVCKADCVNGPSVRVSASDLQT